MSPLEKLRDTPGFRVVAAACRSPKTGKPISVQAVYKWISNGVPPAHVLTIEALGGGKPDRYELRPDIYGARPDGWVSPFGQKREQAAA